MVRLLLLVLALVVTSSAAEAQVFRPKANSKKAAPAAKTAPATAPVKKQPRAAPTKKRPTNPPKKKNAAADRAAPDDLTPEPEPKGAGKDYVKIWDDEDIE